jgi:hypothetical protein
MVSSNVEYSGIFLPITFDNRRFAYDWTQHFFVGGMDSTSFPGEDPTLSRVYIYCGLKKGIHRLAPARVEFKAATLHFKVLDEERAKMPKEGPANWGIMVLHAGEPQGTISLIPQISVVAVDFPGPRSVGRGDVNADGTMDITDPIALLGFLFVGGHDLPCPGSLDYNEDGTADLSDAIGILSCLFLGSCVQGPLEVPCW